MTREEQTPTSRLAWYWHRLRAMDPAEVGGHVRRRFAHFGGSREALRLLRHDQPLEPHAWPLLPDPTTAGATTRRAIADRLEALLSGRWLAFHNLQFELDDPPRWQKDHLAGVDLATPLPGHRLDPRRPPRGADARVIWELNRWDPLIQLAQGAWLLQRRDAALRCLAWLEDWTRANPPFRGWNWTSALESGVRLIALTWIDALLQVGLDSNDDRDRLARTVASTARAHAWFTWRGRSFGSSANNHLLGELAGLIVGSARWPALREHCVSLEDLSRAWNREVLAQFAEDGGNREQALHYQLFAMELCWQTAAALETRGLPVEASVRERLYRAAEFYARVEVEVDAWDYGDSDDAFVIRFHRHDHDPRPEWRRWLAGAAGGEAIQFWLGAPAPDEAAIAIRANERKAANGDCPWMLFYRSGLAVRSEAGWTARLDASPLGYLSTAAHGHLDALHLSLWLDGVAMVVDPGTGTYYADPRLREILASRAAHNGPAPIGLDRPRRLGTFLWSEHHPDPSLTLSHRGVEAVLASPMGRVRRTVDFDRANGEWCVGDRVDPGDPSIPFVDFFVRWQFAPDSALEPVGERAWRVTRNDNAMIVTAAGPWAAIEIGRAPVSPSFRVVVDAPFLTLRAGEEGASGALATQFRRAS